MGCSNQESILININLANFITILRLQNNSLPILNSLHEDLGKRYVGKFKFTFVAALFETNIKHIDWATKRTNSDFRSIVFPSTCSHRVIIFDLFAADFVPLWTLWVEVVNIESVEVSNNASLTGRVEVSACELLHFLIFAVIKAEESVTGTLIECNAPIVSCSQNMGAPG